MFIKSYLWNGILLFISSIYLTIVSGNNHRENLALRHPCNPVNKRLEPYIKWTEKLASTQYKSQKDACGQIGPGPACCTNEIFNSYALSLSNDLKNLFDTKLHKLTNLFSSSNKKIDSWTKEYLDEYQRLTSSSLETLFGTKEYYSNIHHSISTLFDTLGNQQSTDDNVSKSVVNLFNQLIISSYSRFMTINNDIILDENFKKCLVNKAFEIEALPTQRELLYALTSVTSLIHILRTLFIYMDADIQRLKTTVTLDSHQCLQRYARETLCPICVSMPSGSSSINYYNNVNEPLCENDCRYVIKTCFDQTNNPYIAFALIAQGYSNLIKQIQESVVELKLVERLSKLHISLYDMVVNATNTRQTYRALQSACPNSNEKSFSPILSILPITNERRELVTKSNRSLHFMLNQLQSSINKLNITLTQQIIIDICSNSNYAVKSNRCTQIDQHMPGALTQWPLPSAESSLQKTLNLNADLTYNQLNELKKKITPVQQMIISLRPKKKFSYFEILPSFDYDGKTDTNDDDDIQLLPPLVETYDDNSQESFSERLYKDIDEQATYRTTTETMTTYSEEKNFNHCQLITYDITVYLIIFVNLIIHQFSFTKK